MAFAHATQRQIAEVSGVSQEAISQVLRGVGRISPKTRARVLRIAKELGYQRNEPARAMRKGRFGTISIVRCETTNFSYMPEEFLKGLQPLLRQEGINLSMTYVPEDYTPETDAQQNASGYLRSLMADGILANLTESVSHLAKLTVADSGIPAVWFNAKMDTDCVYPDEYHASCEVVKRLLGGSYGRIAFIEPDSVARASLGALARHYSSADRRQGYIDTMVSAGLQPLCIPADDLRAETLRELIVASPGKAKGTIIALGHREALTTMMAACSVGDEVMRDFRLAYFSPAPFSERMLDKYMKAVRIPFRELAACSMGMLLDKIEGRCGVCEPVKVPYAQDSFSELLA